MMIPLINKVSCCVICDEQPIIFFKKVISQLLFSFFWSYSLSYCTSTSTPLHYRGSYCTFTPLHLSDSYFLRSYYCTELRYLHYSLWIILLYFYLSTLHLSISSHLFISWSDFSFRVYNHYMWELKLLCRLHGGFFNYFILSAKLIRQTLNVGFNNRPSW